MTIKFYTSFEFSFKIFSPVQFEIACIVSIFSQYTMFLRVFLVLLSQVVGKEKAGCSPFCMNCTCKRFTCFLLKHDFIAWLLSMFEAIPYLFRRPLTVFKELFIALLYTDITQVNSHYSHLLLVCLHTVLIMLWSLSRTLN